MSQTRGQYLLYYTEDDSLLKDIKHNKLMILNLCISIFMCENKDLKYYLVQFSLLCSHLALRFFLHIVNQLFLSHMVI